MGMSFLGYHQDGHPLFRLRSNSKPVYLPTTGESASDSEGGILSRTDLRFGMEFKQLKTVAVANYISPLIDVAAVRPGCQTVGSLRTQGVGINA